MASPPLTLQMPEDVRGRLAERVRQLRLQREWTQATLAERAGVSLPTVQRYEQQGRATLEVFLKICHALGRLEDLDDVLRPPVAASIAELEANEAAARSKRKRGSR